MSLNWNLENVENVDEVCFKQAIIPPSAGGDGEETRRELRAKTHALIFATMSTKIGLLTEKNASEFYARLKVLEQMWGPFTYCIEDGKKIDSYFTPEDIQAHIGLSTNVVDESRAQFLKFIRTDMDRMVYDYKKAIEKAEAA